MYRSSEIAIPGGDWQGCRLLPCHKDFPRRSDGRTLSNACHAARGLRRFQRYGRQGKRGRCGTWSRGRDRCHQWCHWKIAVRVGGGTGFRAKRRPAPRPQHPASRALPRCPGELLEGRRATGISRPSFHRLLLPTGRIRRRRLQENRKPTREARHEGSGQQKTALSATTSRGRTSVPR